MSVIGNANQITGATIEVAEQIVIGTYDTEKRDYNLGVVYGTDVVLSVTPEDEISTSGTPAFIQGQVLENNVLSLFFTNQRDSGSITIEAGTKYRVIVGRFDNFNGDGL
jgi:hypothetical protein